MTYVDGLSVHDTAAKASVDIALHDLTGKILMFLVTSCSGWIKWVPNTTFTIGMDSEEVVRVKRGGCRSIQHPESKSGW